MYYYVNILLTKNALNTFISNENNFVQNQQRWKEYKNILLK